MHQEPHTDEELRTWLTRHQLMAAIQRLQPCHNGHEACSTEDGGPCHAELVERVSTTARERAFRLAAAGSDRAEVWGVVTREYPILDDSRLEEIIEEAFSHGVA
jgi:hypothetical protein